MGKTGRKKTYSTDFKVNVIMDMREHHMGYRETARKNRLVRQSEDSAANMVQRWERIYLEEGAEGLMKERRGRACSAIGKDYTYDNGVLTIKTDTPIAIANAKLGSTTDQIVVDGGVNANITLAGVNIDVSGQSYTYTAAFKIADNSTGNVTITLADGLKNFLRSGPYCAGLQKNGGSGTLTIKGDAKGTGSLNATGDKYGAGIGGGNGLDITITDGTVIATGGNGCAGIGGDDGSGSNITISGGKVTAIGNKGGACRPQEFRLI